MSGDVRAHHLVRRDAADLAQGDAGLAGDGGVGARAGGNQHHVRRHVAAVRRHALDCARRAASKLSARCGLSSSTPWRRSSSSISSPISGSLIGSTVSLGLDHRHLRAGRVVSASAISRPM